jgi:putative phosphoesterase
MLPELERFNGPVHLIYGNNVGDQHLISQRCGVRYTTITHHGLLGAVEAGGVRFAFHHLPQIARMIATQGGFDVVCCGHTHLYKLEEIGDVLLVNPGDLLGSKEQPGFVVYETNSRTVERVDIGVPFFPDEI